MIRAAEGDRTDVLLLSINWIARARAEESTLAKRASNSATDSIENKKRNSATALKREYVPVEEDAGASGIAPEGATHGPAHGPEKPSIHDVFYPGELPDNPTLVGLHPSDSTSAS